MLTLDQIHAFRAEAKAILAEKGATNISGQISLPFEDDNWRAYIIWNIPGQEDNGKMFRSNLTAEGLEYHLNYLRSTHSEADVKLRALLEAIALVRDSASELGIDLPEDWVNPINELSDKLRSNALEDKRNGD